MAVMKKLLAYICLCSLVCTIFSVGTVAAESNTSGTSDVQTQSNTSSDSYKDYCQKYNSILTEGCAEITLDAAAYTTASDTGITVLNGYAGKEKPLLEWKSVKSDTAVSWKFKVENGGKYCIALNYYALENNSNQIDLAFRINGAYPFRSCESLSFSKIWTNEVQEFAKDAAGNEKRPAAKQVSCWQSTFISDSEGVANDPYEFVFFEGENEITLEGISTDFVLDSIVLTCAAQTGSYQSYLASASGNDNAADTDAIIIQCEQTTYRSDSSIVPMEDRCHASTMPSNPVYTRYNTVGDYNWQTQGQWIYWEFNVKEAGFYNIGMRVRQNYQRGYASARRVYIDGEVPFSELSQVEFNYNRGWYFQTLGNDEPYTFYFEPGTHSIALEVIPGNTAELNQVLQQSVTALNTIYRNIIMITGSSPDTYRDYCLDQEIPNLIGDMTAQRDVLKQQYENLQNKYGGRDSDTATIQRLIAQLTAFIEDADTITDSITTFSDNISSLSSLVVRLKEQPLEMDYIEIKPAEGEFTDTSVGFFGNLAFGVRQFVGSFVTDYSAVGSDAGDSGESLNVWVSLGRDQSQLIRELVDNSFSKQNNISVSIKLSKGSLIQATFAGTGPDVALFVATDQPVNLAVRGALIDVSEFSDSAELLSQFSEEELVPFRYGSGLYGVPLTADISMMFVRTDIFKELGLAIPQTWDQLYSIIPTLQRSNMNVGLPKVTIEGGGLGVFNSLLLQNGQNYYNDRLSATAFDSEVALDAFREWTGYYTKYDVPIDYDFYNRFRSGEIPIGLDSYTMYNKLAVAAPEIAGMWQMVPIPGTVQDDGSIDRSTSVGCTAAVILDNGCNKEAAWSFVKWFSSADVQGEYGRRIEALIGEAARYNAANLGAIGQLPWTLKEVDLIMDQMESARGIPQSIASYYVTRNLYNAYRKVTVNNSNPREVLYRYSTQMNDEITRKREEFGLEKGE